MNVEGTLSLTSSEVDKDGNPITVDIEITSEDSLKDIADKINKQSKNSSVSANIIDNQLVLTNTKMGTKILLSLVMLQKV